MKISPTKHDAPLLFHQAQENKLGLLSHLGCGIKTPQSLGERLTHTLTGTGTGTGRNW